MAHARCSLVLALFSGIASLDDSDGSRLGTFIEKSKQISRVKYCQNGQHDDDMGEVK